MARPLNVGGLSLPVMRLHNWSRVDAGTWHGFHLHWTSRLCEHLNNGRLPAGFYADAERSAVERVPDVLAIEEADFDVEPASPTAADGLTAVLAPPGLKVHAAGGDPYSTRRRRIAVRRDDGDRLAAVIELASPGNKTSRREINAFVEKTTVLLEDGIHVSIIDVSPTTGRLLPDGLIAATAEGCGLSVGDAFAEKPGGIAAFEAASPGRGLELWAEPLAAGDALPDLPLFLMPGRHVAAALADSYAAAFGAMAPKWRRTLDA